MHRDQQLLELRPSLGLPSENLLPDEHFQNIVFRPILKLQHHLIEAVFKNYLEEKSIKFQSQSAFQQRITIENAVKRDLPLRHTLFGCIIGLLTADEYATYLVNRIDYNKRLSSLLIQRLSDTFIRPGF
jgi:hypothetical protein